MLPRFAFGASAAGDSHNDLTFRGGSTEAALKVTVSPRARVMRLRVDPRTAQVLLTMPKRV